METKPPTIILPHGGYRKLLSYRKAVLIFLGTDIFVRRFLSPYDRTVDQMIQAARSGKQNIIEGSEASGISKETEIKLTGVARASFEELLEDYRDYLCKHQLPQWSLKSREVAAVNRLCRESDECSRFRPLFEQRSDGTCANILICLICKCNFLLDRQLIRLQNDFVKSGGLRERMTRSRIEYRKKK